MTPLLHNKPHDQPSAFLPENMLREARRQKNIPEGNVPPICLLDPDGDIVRSLRASGRATRNPHWACYHTDMFNFEHGGMTFGIIGCAIIAFDTVGGVDEPPNGLRVVKEGG